MGTGSSKVGANVDDSCDGLVSGTTSTSLAAATEATRTTSPSRTTNSERLTGGDGSQGDNDRKSQHTPKRAVATDISSGKILNMDPTTAPAAPPAPEAPPATATPALNTSKAEGEESADNYHYPSAPPQNGAPPIVTVKNVDDEDDEEDAAGCCVLSVEESCLYSPKGIATTPVALSPATTGLPPSNPRSAVVPRMTETTIIYERRRASGGSMPLRKKLPFHRKRRRGEEVCYDVECFDKNTKTLETVDERSGNVYGDTDDEDDENNRDEEVVSIQKVDGHLKLADSDMNHPQQQQEQLKKRRRRNSNEARTVNNRDEQGKDYVQHHRRRYHHQQQKEELHQAKPQERLDWQVSTQPLLVALHQALLPTTMNGLPFLNDDGQGWPENFHLPAGSGCLLHVNLPPSMGTPENRFWCNPAVRNKIHSDLDLGQLLHQFLMKPVDTLEDMAQAAKLFYEKCDCSSSEKRGDGKTEVDGSCDKSTTSAVNRPCFENCYGVTEDLLWWQCRLGVLPLKDLAKLRRILLPFSLLVTSDHGKHVVSILPLNWSLAGLILEDRHGDEEGTNLGKSNAATFVRALLRTLQSLKQVNHTQVVPIEQIVQYREIQELIVNACRSFGGSLEFDGQQLDMKSLTMMQDVPLPTVSSITRRCYSIERAAELKNIEQKRKELLREDLKHGNVSFVGRKCRPRSTVIVQDITGITEEEFLKETSFMHRVNCTFPRRFDLVESRPRFVRTQFTADELSQLRRVFFNDDGSLNRSTCQDASRTFRNHYIIFCNDSGAGCGDKRWQIPMKSHITGRVPTRTKVEKLLYQSGILDSRYERVQDLVLLIGGTEDQSLHHDLPRDWVTWRKSSASFVSSANRTIKNDHSATAMLADNKQPSTNYPNSDPCSSETVGWEANRLGYNRAMLSKEAPAALLIPMNPGNFTSTSVLSKEEPFLTLGVQKDQIIRCTKKTCRIRHGDPCEVFEIIRETKHIAVLKVYNGCMFTGDFPHAGASCCSQSSVSDNGESLSVLVKQFATGVDQILGAKSNKGLYDNRRMAALSDYCDDDMQETSSVLDFCSQFKGLNRLCRLYMATERKSSALNVPPNAVGYYKCYSNQPTTSAGRSE